MLSMKFPHLFLRPEIIITFLWGWEWSGGQVRHRSPRNSGCIYISILSKLVLMFAIVEHLPYILDTIKILSIGTDKSAQ